MRRHRRLIALLFVLATLSLFLARCTRYLYLPQGPFGPVSVEFDPEWGRGELLEKPQPIRARIQREGHTCGYHALAAIYEAYGRNPELARLRFRLGADMTVIPGFGGTKGTLHPDLLRVLAQDGFSYELLDPESAADGSELADHLGDGQPALILEKRAEGGLHWVVADALQDGDLRLVDSLAENPRLVGDRDYLETQVISLILLRKRGGESEPSFWAAHREGIVEMERVRGRLRQME